jgi:hypothetical protein
MYDTTKTNKTIKGKNVIPVKPSTAARLTKAPIKSITKPA